MGLSLSDKNVNSGRQFEVDAIKFLAAPFMICICSAVFFVAFTAGLLYIGYDIRNIYVLSNDTYYHHSIIATLCITPIIIFALGTCYLISVKADNTKVGSFIRYCSVNLNTIYIIKWLIIAYSVAISILLSFDKTCSSLVIISGGIIVTVISILISVPFVKRKV